MAEAKKGDDINNYNEAIALLSSVINKDSGELIDTNWLSEKEKKNAAETKRLENELKQYKNNLIRESIRVCLCSRSCLKNNTDMCRWAAKNLESTTTTQAT